MKAALAEAVCGAAIVIPNWNGRRFLDGCLASLARQTVGPVRTIVVDNGSTDGSREALTASWPAVEVIANERNLGFAAAMNQGFARAFETPSCRWVIALNNDTVVEPRFVEALLVAGESSPGAGSFQAKMVAADEPGVLDATGIYLRPDLSAHQLGSGIADSPERFPAAEILGACAGAALYRRAALETAAPDGRYFDPGFFAYFEDVDLALRLRLLGWRSEYVPEAVVRHIGSATAQRESPFKYYWLARNRWRYVARAVPLDLLLARLPLVALDPAFLALYLARRRAWPAALATIRGTLAGIVALPRAIRDRWRLPRARAGASRDLARFIRRRVRAWSGPS
jgi:GT2 family glycosyltransferase